MIDWDAFVIGPLVKEFGGPVSYAPAAGGAFEITGVFDHEYLDQNPIGGLGEMMGAPGNVSAMRPVLGIQLSQFPNGVAPLQGDALTVIDQGSSFKVMEVRADGKGWAKLLLNNA